MRLALDLQTRFVVANETVVSRGGAPSFGPFLDEARACAVAEISGVFNDATSIPWYRDGPFMAASALKLVNEGIMDRWQPPARPGLPG